MKINFIQNVKKVTVTRDTKNITVKRDTKRVVINGNRGLRGREGLSAFDVWLAQGNEGTIDDFFLATGSLREVDDNIIAENSTYSSQMIEDRLDEEVGTDDFDFVLLFENGLSV